MRRAFPSSLVLIALMLVAVACSSGGDLNKPETQSEFGVRMAKMNLWREAMFRFRRAVEIDPNDAQARNNLAVALEAVGDFDAAAKEYREALRLDRTDQHIQKNYSRYVEFMQRSKKREAGGAAAAPARAAAPAPEATPAVPDAVPAAPASTAPPVTDSAPPATDTAPPPPPPTTTNPPQGDPR